MKLIILFGPPSVGKTTVGKLIEEQSNYKLFHNHMVTDNLMHIFGLGSPAENRLSRLVRNAVIEEAANSGIDLVFTYVWNFAIEKGKQNIESYKTLYQKRGGVVYFVELVAPIEVRVERANNPERYLLKTQAAKSNDIEDLEKTRDFYSPTPFYYPKRYLRIDTTNTRPDETAREIINWQNKLS